MSEYRARQAAAAGERAANAGKRRDTNDRPRGTYFYDCWMDGYDHIANTWDAEKHDRLCGVSA